MSLCRASSLSDHLDHCFVVFKHIQQSFMMSRFDVWGNKTNIIQIISLRLLAFVNRVSWRTNFTFCSLTGRPVLHSSDSCSQELQRSDPINQVREYHPTSILHPKKRFLILLNCAKTEVFFLHIQLIGTNVWLPKTHNVPSEVDFESSRSPAKSESWNSPNLHCLAVLPT